MYIRCCVKGGKKWQDSKNSIYFSTMFVIILDYIVDNIRHCKKNIELKKIFLG